MENNRHITAVLVKKAHSMYKRIKPCTTDHVLTWEECIDIIDNKVILYFNLPNKKNSTTAITIIFTE